MPDEMVTAGSFDQMRLHITEQLQRIADENKLRADALQREIDQQIAHRLDTFRLLQEELDRRFEDGRRETDERLAATVSVRVSLHEELDRRFAELREHTLETARLLQEEMDRRLTSEEVRRTDLKALLDERARNALAARTSLQQEIDRRFTEAATAVRVALEGAEKAVAQGGDRERTPGWTVSTSSVSSSVTRPPLSSPAMSTRPPTSR